MRQHSHSAWDAKGHVWSPNPIAPLAVRLFVGDPVWTPYNRQTPDLPPQVDDARRAYAGLLERLSASGLVA